MRVRLSLYRVPAQRRKGPAFHRALRAVHPPATALGSLAKGCGVPQPCGALSSEPAL